MSTRPRILLCGRGSIAIRCLDELLKQDADVAWVVPDIHDDGNDGWRGSLLKHATGKNIPVYQRKLNTPEAAEWFAGQNIDLLLSCQYPDILRASILTAAAKGAINLHFAPLPRYRGCYPIPWTIINGEREMGISLHYIDEGIDTGDIVGQRFFPVRKEDTARTLFDRCIDEGVLLFREYLPSILAGTNPRTPQDNALATYYSRDSIDFSKRTIDWQQPAEKLFNWIRAFIFPPLQWPETTHKGAVLRVGNVEHASIRPEHAPGTVIACDEHGMTVAAIDGALRLSAFVSDDGSPGPMPKAAIGDTLH
jgi:methionyl-tRNA formyltransferase